MLRLIATCANHGELNVAARHWCDVRQLVPDALAAPEVLVRLAPALLLLKQRDRAITAVRDAIDRCNGPLAATHALQAIEMGLPSETVARGLAAFQSTPEDNPGRLNEFMLGDVRVLVDFAHNPHGMAALFELVDALPARGSCTSLGAARPQLAIRHRSLRAGTGTVHPPAA